MPVTAQLSRLFYDKMGDQVANELVNWFNAVDATYRSDLRELNENNFARFDAKVEQRFAEADAKWEKRFGALESQLFALQAEVRSSIAESDSRVLALIAQSESRLHAVIAQSESRLHASIAASHARLLQWMFVFWTGNAVVTAGIVLAALRFKG